MDRRQGFDEARLEQALRDLGPRLAWPEGAALATTVAASIRAGELPRISARARRYPRLVAFGTAAIVGLASLGVAVWPGAREAVADFLGIGGVRIDVGRPGPTPTAGPGENLSLGVETTLEDAAARVDFPVRLPRVPELPAEPERVYYSDFPAGGRVSLVYRARPGLPEASATGVGLLVTEFQGELDPELAKKIALQQQVDPTQVRGRPAFWVRGPHTLFFLDAEGKQRADTLRLSANALIWMEGDTTIRLESELSLAESLRIAESME